MPNRSALRGAALDEAVDALLAQMISLGFDVAPISRPEVQRRLGLTSRATLGGDRGARIEAARVAQLKESGRDPDATRRRRTLEERIEKLKAENADLLLQRDLLYESLAAIVQNCMLKGLDVEHILAPLRKR